MFFGAGGVVAGGAAPANPAWRAFPYLFAIHDWQVRWSLSSSLFFPLDTAL
jgi:hypothetical protein